MEALVFKGSARTKHLVTAVVPGAIRLRRFFFLLVDVVFGFWRAEPALAPNLQSHTLAESHQGGYLMRHSLLPVVAGAFVTLVNSSGTSAQRHEIPQLNSCIKEFYDPEMYNYLTFKNTCSKSLTIVFVAKDGSGTSGTMELRPGGKDSIGKSQGNDPQPGSFELYVCQTGYIPVDDNNQLVSKPASNFRCQQKVQ
jgi:hypothetical protein